MSPAPATSRGHHARLLLLLVTVGALLLALAGVPANAASTPVLRGSQSTSGNTDELSLQVPDGTQEGDVLLLFASVNRMDVTIANPAGWDQVGHLTNDSIQTQLWTSVADGSSTVTVRTSQQSKVNLQVLAYRGVDQDDPIAAVALAGEPDDTSAHTGPIVDDVTSGARIVYYWADKTSATTNWSTPSSVSRVRSEMGSGDGRITSVTAEAVSRTASVGGVEATASSSNHKATAVTVVLADGGGGDEPVDPPAPTAGIHWDLDEAPGATIMRAASGHGPDGAIGDLVNVGQTIGSATAYGFPFAGPNVPEQQPGHLVIVDDDPRLDATTSSFEVTVRMRSTHPWGNMIQKGQAQAEGGMWKFEMPGGAMTCLYRDATGKDRAVSSGIRVDDGAWHVISCRKDSEGLTMTVDGVVTMHRDGSLGSIDNEWPLSIGGKPVCNQRTVECDYFTGSIDWVNIQRN